MHLERFGEVFLRHAAAQPLVSYPAAQRFGWNQELVRVPLRECLFESFGEMRKQPPEDSGLDIPGLIPLDPADRVAGKTRDLR